METTNIIYCGALLEVPIIDGAPLHMPHSQWDWGTDTYCGPGYLGDKLVPDKLPGGTFIMAV